MNLSRTIRLAEVCRDGLVRKFTDREYIRYNRRQFTRLIFSIQRVYIGKYFGIETGQTNAINQDIRQQRIITYVARVGDIIGVCRTALSEYGYLLMVSINIVDINRLTFASLYENLRQRFTFIDIHIIREDIRIESRTQSLVYHRHVL